MKVSASRSQFPGTVHYINPKVIPEDADEVLISSFGRFVRILGVAVLLYVIVVAIHLLMHGITGLGFGDFSALIENTRNPITCLALGALATFLVQSSTVVTTITVAAVGGGLIGIREATMVILGANIGTCFTALLVAFAYARSREQLRQALAAAITHWFFNIASVAFFFPIELIFHPLERLSHLLAHLTTGGTEHSIPTGGLVRILVTPLIDAFCDLLGHTPVTAIVSIILGGLLIAGSVQLLTILLRTLMAYRSHVLLEQSKERKESIWAEFGLGLGLTLLTHSSSATTSATVPFAGTGTLGTRGALGIVLGANLGTTLTAVLAAITIPGSSGTVALQAAFIHVLINLIGVAAVLFTRPLADAIVRVSESLGRISAEHRTAALGLWFASYIALPALLVWLNI